MTGVSMKYSIKKKFAMIFMSVMAGMILLCFILNSCFLEKYYISRSLNELQEAYQIILEETKNGGAFQNDFYNEVQNICEKHNISVLVVNSESDEEISAGFSGVKEMKLRLINNIYMSIMNQKESREKEEPKSLSKQDDKPNAQRYDWGKEYDQEQIYEETEQYVVKSVIDPVSDNEYIEMWGFIDGGYVFLIRSTKAAIHESVKISNLFLAYTGAIAVVIGGILIWLASKKITEPIRELNEVSNQIRQLRFDVKYTPRIKKADEIDLLGQNINSLAENLEKTISELKTANNELKKDIEAKTQIDEMRKEFLSNVTHELKTPIALIQGYAEGLKEGITDDPESMEFYCDVIIDESAKMNQMVKNLLTLSHLESGQDAVAMERFDIVAMIRNYLENASVLIRQNELEVHFDEVNPIYVWGDEFKVEEVFMNYFTNAIHYADERKLIDIRVERQETHARVTVFNSGLPIPKDSIDRVWEKFYKVDKARTREYGGSGVGLSIVKAIMESMNQNYGVENYDDGVKFWFELETK